jgi:hypothetical protein
MNHFVAGIQDEPVFARVMSDIHSKTAGVGGVVREQRARGVIDTESECTRASVFQSQGANTVV